MAWHPGAMSPSKLCVRSTQARTVLGICMQSACASYKTSSVAGLVAEHRQDSCSLNHTGCRGRSRTAVKWRLSFSKTQTLWELTGPGSVGFNQHVGSSGQVCILDMGELWSYICPASKCLISHTAR